MCLNLFQISWANRISRVDIINTKCITQLFPRSTILSTNISRRTKHFRNRLGSNSLQEEEEESEETKAGMIRITDYANEKTILEPQSPTKPDDVILRTKIGTDEESHKKRKALRKIRSNSLVQTDV